MRKKFRSDSDAPMPSTAHSLNFLLLKAREATVAPIRSMLADTGLTEQQWRVLRVLDEYGPQDATQVADRACLLISSLTRITFTMRNKGLITENQDLADRRRKNLAITEEGFQVIDACRIQASEISAEFRDFLGEEQHELLLNLLTQLVATGRDQHRREGEHN